MKNVNEMNKTELRAACKAAGINYSKLTVGGMRDTLAALQTEPAPVAADPRTLETCPKCGSTDLYAGTGVKGLIEHEDTVGGCHLCDWAYDLRRPATKPTGKGIKIEKDRDEQNGIKRPSAGGMCRAIWDALDTAKAEGWALTAKDVKEIATKKGWNLNNANIEFYQWRKFHGIRGRQAKPAA